MQVTLSALLLWCTLEWYSCCEVVRIFAGTDKIPVLSVSWTLVTILTKWTKEEVWIVMYFSCAKRMSVWEATVSTERLVKQDPWHGSMWTSWTLVTWRFLITFPIVLIWHHWISTHSPKLRSVFQSLHFQTDGDVRVEFRHWLCLQDHHCTTRALTDIPLWQVSQQVWQLLHSILHMMFLYRTVVLLTVNYLYYK
jgi:hypothetical protein